MTEVNLLSSGAYKQLQEIEQQRQLVQVALEGVGIPEVRAAYEDALARLGESAIKLAQSEELQSGYAGYGEEAARGLEQLDPLRGILPEDSIVPLEFDLKTRIQLVRVFFEKYGVINDAAREFIDGTPQALAVVATTEIVPVISLHMGSEPIEQRVIIAEPKTPETQDTVPTTVEVILGETGVFLGRQKRMIPLSQRRHEAQSDYSDDRRSALKVLVDMQGEWTLVHDLWMRIHPESSAIDNNVTKNIRSWLLGLTYRRSPLVEFNGKRGPAAAYRISPNFHLIIAEGQKVDRGSPEVIQSLEAADMFVTARHLEQFNFVLRQSGCPEIDEKIVKALEKFKPDYSHIKGDAGAIRRSRIEAIARVERFINDEEWMYRFVENTDTSRADYKFVEYLSGLEEDQLALIKRLVTCRVERVPTEGGHYRIEALDEAGRIVAWSEPFNKTVSEFSRAPTVGTDAEVELKNDNNQDPTTGKVKAPGDKAVDVARESAETPQLPAASKKDGTIPEKFDETESVKLNALEVLAFDTAMTLLEHLNPDSAYTIQHIRNFLPKFSPHRAASAKDKRVVSKEKHKMFTVKEVVRIIIYTDNGFQNIFTNRKYKRVVEDKIERALKQAIDMSKPELTAETEVM